MNFDTIQWRALFKVTSEQKALKLLAQVRDTVEREVTLVNCKKYWKDNSLFEVNFTSALGIDDISKAILETLLVCQMIGHGWYVTGPRHCDNGCWEFDGLTDKTLISGLQWIHFTVSNVSNEK